MKNKLLSLVMAAAIMFGFVTPVCAETYSSDYTVTYDGSNLSQNLGTDPFKNLEPGDTVTVKATLKNSSSKATNWYMKNQVAQTLEQLSSASDGAYTYELSFNDEVFYSSTSVGGDNSNGLGEVNTVFNDEWYLLGNIAAGGTGTVTLKVTLDGYTQKNNYFNTEGALTMQFGVEQATATEITKPGEDKKLTVVKTGSETGLSFYSILAMVSGLALIILAFLLGRKEKKEA